MPIECPTCSHPLSVVGALPKFCSNCGSSLANIETETVDGTDFTKVKDQNTSIEPGSDTESLDFATLPPTRGGDTANTPTQHSGPAVTVIVGSKIGPFEIVRKLGQGGMGSVYEARHEVTGQCVALKLLSRSLRTDDETIQRFQRESQIAASINHPRSTFVYQAGQHEGQFYITMELMPGGTLSDIIKTDGAISVDRAVDYVLDMISGLQAAHEAGIVHRDLKPSNCFVDENDRVKIGDFGLAKSFLADSSLTQTGTFMGTPQFAAPEQLRASDVDERADIYAIGGTLFYLISGRAPFTGNAAQVIASIASDTPPKLDTIVKDVPRKLVQLVHQTLEKDPAKRPANLEEVRHALLPYSSRGASRADLGRRLAAYFIDLLTISMMGMIVGPIMGVFQPLFESDFKTVNIFSMAMTMTLAVLYFTVCESRFGYALGKWMMGLRVVGRTNHHPDFGQAFVRATILPGSTYFLSLIIAYLLEFDPVSMASEEDIRRALEFQILTLVVWLPGLLLFWPARKQNGYLAWHGMVSGTRVVRLAGSLEYRRPRKIPTTVPVVSGEADSTNNSPGQIGDYEKIGQIGVAADLSTPVFLGRDPGLDREVWMFQADPASDARKAISRPTRLRIISESQDTGEHWRITESVRGMSLFDFVRDTRRLEWRSFRPLLQEIVYELAKSQSDGTYPDFLDQQSVWIDHSGRARLIDQPIFATEIKQKLSELGNDESVDDDDEPMFESPEKVSPIELVQRLLQHFIKHQVAPVHVLEFQKELKSCESDAESLKAVGERLGELANSPSAWNWDDRLGVLAVSTSLEAAIGANLCWMVATICDYYLALPTTALVISMIVLFGSIAFTLGWFFQGGPAFRFTGVSLRKNKTLEPASKFRMAFRNLISWLPMILTGTLGSAVFSKSFNFVKTEQIMAQANVDYSVYMLLVPAFFIFMIALLGAIYSIARPSRGIQDLITGTRLIRK